MKDIIEALCNKLLDDQALLKLLSQSPLGGGLGGLGNAEGEFYGWFGTQAVSETCIPILACWKLDSKEIHVWKR